MNDEETDLLRQLIDNLDQFREATVETFRVLHRKQKATDERVTGNKHTIDLHGVLLWIILGTAVIGLVALLLLLLT